MKIQKHIWMPPDFEAKVQLSAEENRRSFTAHLIYCAEIGLKHLTKAKGAK